MALILLWAATAPAADYYLDSAAGDDAASGATAGAPWRTLAPLRSVVLSPGDVVHFKRGGDWSGGLTVRQSGAEGLPILLTAYGDGPAPILRSDGGDWSSVIRLEGDWVVLDGLSLRDAYEAGVLIAAGSDHNVVRNCDITATGFGVWLGGRNNLVTGCHLHDLHMIRNTPGGDDDYGAVGVVISNFGNDVLANRMTDCLAPSYDYGTDGGAVEWWCDGVDAGGSRVQYNTVERCNGLMEIGGANWGTCHDVTVSHNLVIDSGLAALHVADAFGGVDLEGFRFEHNTVVNRIGGWRLFWWDHAPRPQAVVVRNNIFVSNIRVYEGAGASHASNLYQFLAGGSLGDAMGEGESTADPMFLNAPAGDFRLAHGSPAIDQGLALGYLRDHDGLAVPFGPAPDLGAFELWGILGDFNCDGAVTHGDYTIWADSFGRSIASVQAEHPGWFPSGSYPPGATTVTQGLYTTWADHFGDVSMAVSQFDGAEAWVVPAAMQPLGPKPSRAAARAIRIQSCREVRLQRAAERQARRQAAVRARQ